MINRKNDEAFWPSYVDLMTSLFVVMLVLFIFSYAAYSVERRNLRVKAENYQRLQNIDAAIAKLANKEQFKYEPEYKRYVFRQDVQFKIGDFTIDSKYYDFLIKSGSALSSLVENLKTDARKDSTKKEIRYLIIIEGMASRDNSGYADNFNLSYKRAHALYQFWKDHHIDFDPEVCEVMVAGSGTDGVGRYKGDEESKNQRFLIQIIPKVAYQK